MRREEVARTFQHILDYLLICPNMATATIFMAEAPRGFYGQLVKGKVPAWLQPIDLGRDSPYKMWKVVGDRKATEGKLMKLTVRREYQLSR